MANIDVNGDIFTTRTIDSAVFTLFIAVEVSGDMNVRLASAAVTNRKVSSQPLSRESPVEGSTLSYCPINAISKVLFL